MITKSLRLALFAATCLSASSAAAEPQFINCDESQQKALTTAKQRADTLALGAELYMGNGDPTDPVATRPEPFKTWFDAQNTDYHRATVRTNVRNINAAIHGTERYDCTGTDEASCVRQKAIAFVDNTDTFHTIYLCPPFWKFGDTTPNYNEYTAKPGILIHEMSHFSDVASTRDEKCSFYRCQELSTTKPDVATLNAYNYEYFELSDPLSGVPISGCSMGSKRRAPAAGGSGCALLALLVPGATICRMKTHKARVAATLLRFAFLVGAGGLYAGCAHARASQPLPDTGLRTSLRVEMVPLTGRLEAVVTWTNVGPSTLRLLRWNTPMDGYGDGVMVVAPNGARLTRLGRYNYYGEDPDDAAYLTLAPGGQLVDRIDLAKSFDMSASGTYLVRLYGNVGDVVVGATVPKKHRWRDVWVETAPVTVQIGAAPPLPSSTPTP